MNHKLLADATLEQVNGTGNFNPSETGGTLPAVDQIERLFSTLFGFLTIVAGLSFLVYFIIGALNWVTAGGDAKKVDTAKSYMTNGAVGMIVVVAAYSIIWIVGQVLGFNILNPAFELQKIFNNLDGTPGPIPGSGGSTVNPATPI